MYNRLDRIQACDGQTDRQTDGQTSCHGIVRAVHTRRAVKTVNRPVCVLCSSSHCLVQNYNSFCALHIDAVTSVSSRYDKPPLAARCCHVANDFTNFTGDRDRQKPSAIA